VFRAYPTRPQEGRAVKLLRDHCDLYNAALEERREAWRMRKAPVSCGMQPAQLKDIRQADLGGQGGHSFTAQQQTLRRLDNVFAAFFERARNAERNGGNKPGYPRFKPYSRFRQVRFVNGDGAKWIPADGGGWARAASPGPGQDPAPGSASAAHWPTSGAKSVTGAGTSTTRPRGC
jgi:putative transposase